jgi:hypothetical protein
MNIFKSAPLLAFLAAVIIGCEGKPPVEAYCEARASCGLLEEETQQDCTMQGNVALTFLRQTASCADLADEFEDLMSCESDLSCEDLKADDAEPGNPTAPGAPALPATSPCRAEKVAFIDKASAGQCPLFSSDPQPQ